MNLHTHIIWQFELVEQTLKHRTLTHFHPVFSLVLVLHSFKITNMQPNPGWKPTPHYFFPPTLFKNTPPLSRRTPSPHPALFLRPLFHFSRSCFTGDWFHYIYSQSRWVVWGSSCSLQHRKKTWHLHATCDLHSNCYSIQDAGKVQTRSDATSSSPSHPQHHLPIPTPRITQGLATFALSHQN